MDWLGRKQLGQEMAVTLTAVDADDVPGWPTAAPVIDIWRGATLALSGLAMPKVDGAATGFFRLNLFLNERFSTGYHEAVVRWVLNGWYGVAVQRFEVIAGGDARGTIIALFHHEMPQERYLIAQTDAGRLLKLKRPSF